MQAQQQSAVLQQAESDAASSRNRLAMRYGTLENAAREEHRLRCQAEEETNELRATNAELISQVARLRAEVKHLQESNATIGRAAAAAAAAAAEAAGYSAPLSQF